MNGNNLILMKEQSSMFLFLMLLILAPCGFALNSNSPGTLNIGTTYPNFRCSSFCMYQINSNFNYEAMCVTTVFAAANTPQVVGSGVCTQCDPLLFRAVTPGVSGGVYCIPHLYNSESLEFNIVLQYRLGYSTIQSAGTFNWVSQRRYTPAVVLKPHHKIRVRFGLHLYRFQLQQYDYPINYTIDDYSATYHQQMNEYWSPYDIVTTPQINHTDNNVVLTWTITLQGLAAQADVSCPNYGFTNGHTCRTYGAACVCGTCSTICCYSSTNCFNRYIEITDLLIFATLCPNNCLNCTSSTQCQVCDNTNASLRYYRYPADNQCYLTCPQATYKDNTTTFFTNAGVIDYICSTCNMTCLECTDFNVCTKCYYAGRNESFLYNNTCVNPCYNGYQANYTTHQCVCPLDYYYEIVVSLICNPCAIQCVRCFGPTNLECTYCEKNYYLANQTTHCLIRCPDGQYENPLTRTCINCDPSCSSCKGQSTYCTKCFISNTVKYLLNGECLTWCPDGYAWNNVTYRCEECALYTYSVNGKCVQFCPAMHQANLQNKSCIHYSKTGFTYNLTLISVSILNHGKLLKLQILAQDGLNIASYDAIMKRSYHNVQVVYKQARPITLARSLASTYLPIRNIQYMNNKIYYYVQLPNNLDYSKTFQVVFNEPIAGNQNIYYNNFTTVFPVSQHPQIMKSYYLFTAKNIYNVIMVAFVVIVIFLFSLQLKGVYDLFMECFRMVQILGLLVYSAFPIGPYVFYFLIGCSYANLDFIPNLYALVAKPQNVKNFQSYSLTAEDMDFIRLNGSVLFFAVIWAVVILVSAYLFRVKENRVKYMVAFGVDLMQVKIMHSFWSSLIFVIINYNLTNFSVFITFAFAFLIFVAIIARRYAIWKDQKDISPFFVWRLTSTLLICFISLSNVLVISLIFCLAVGATIWQFYLLHSPKYLISINSLNSANYMSEKTYKVLNNYDEEVKFCWSISIRNTIITMLPAMTAILTAILILLKDMEYEVIIFTSVMAYFFMLLAIVNAIFIFNFLQERRKYLVQNKLEFLQKKYAKLSTNQTIIYEERRRPRVSNFNTIDEQKYLEQNPARRMMKNIE